MSLYVLTSNPGFIDMVKAAAKTGAVTSAATAADMIQRVATGTRAKFEVLLVDLGAAPDAERLVDFIKGSGSLSGVNIVLVGTEAQLVGLGAATISVVDAMLRARASR